MRENESKGETSKNKLDQNQIVKAEDPNLSLIYLIKHIKPHFALKSKQNLNDVKNVLLSNFLFQSLRRIKTFDEWTKSLPKNFFVHPGERITYMQRGEREGGGSERESTLNSSRIQQSLFLNVDKASQYREFKIRLK